MIQTHLIQPEKVREILGRHILVDGLPIVMDLKASHHVYVVDEITKKPFLDFFGCFATIPLGYNHPKMVNDPEFLEELQMAALTNPTNSDIYTRSYARFMEVFERVAIPSYLPHAFFIAGGALAVENALKVAMDWKVQKNFQKGYTREVGHQVIHFKDAFHGRSGYTLSLTNTDPTKTKYFAKFNWPRIINPKLRFPITEEVLEEVKKMEALAVAQIKMAFKEHGDDICAIIIEPIQSEGGDHHFRPEFFKQLRTLADENDVLLIYDEVQVGVAATGRFWAHEHFGVEAQPDIIAFGKKMQICGILAGTRIDEIPTNCFTISSRINSTWGGNLVDMVRARKILEVIEEDNLTHHAEETGAYLLQQLQELSAEFPQWISNVRGRGLIVAFDLPNPHVRDQFVQEGLKRYTLFLKCGPQSIRFRPPLVIQKSDIDKGIQVIRDILTSFKRN